MFRTCLPSPFAAFLAAPVLLLGLASARAADPASDEVAIAGYDDVVSRTVSVADLNLTLPDDQRTLRHRISVAARRVCMEAGGNTAVQDDSLQTCYQTSLHDAWATAQDRIQVAMARANLMASAHKPVPQAQEVASSAGR